MTGPVWEKKTEVIEEVAKKMGIKLKLPANLEHLYPEDFAGIPVREE